MHSEAAAMAAYAQSLMPAPVHEGAWLLEEASTSTRENAMFSLEMLRCGLCLLGCCVFWLHQCSTSCRW